MVGRLIWDKGISDFIKIAGIVRSRFPNVKFVWAGDHIKDNHPQSVPKSFITNNSKMLSLLVILMISQTFFQK